MSNETVSLSINENPVNTRVDEKTATRKVVIKTRLFLSFLDKFTRLWDGYYKSSLVVLPSLIITNLSRCIKKGKVSYILLAEETSCWMHILP
ncbi:hypothetical protein BH18THE2_BH18THE2_15240 [soil metagenome]